MGDVLGTFPFDWATILASLERNYRVLAST